MNGLCRYLTKSHNTISSFRLNICSYTTIASSTSSINNKFSHTLLYFPFNNKHVSLNSLYDYSSNSLNSKNSYCTKSTPTKQIANKSKNNNKEDDQLYLVEDEVEFNKEQSRNWKKIKDKIDESIWRSIKETDWIAPTDIQNAIIKHILENRNVLASSKTGNGKTAAYSIPLLQIVKLVKEKIKNNNINKEDEIDEDETTSTKKINNIKVPVINTKVLNENDPLGLVIVPSKELAIQVKDHMMELAKHMNLRIECIFGGVGEYTQEQQLKSGVDILIGTTGAITQNLSKGTLNLRQVHMTVLDEFDKLFNYGFFPDIKEIFDCMPLIGNKSRDGMQTALFSATINFDKHNDLITRFSPYHIMENFNQELTPPKEVRQHFYQIDHRKKRSLLLYFFRRGGKTSLKNSKVIIFVRTQQRAENLANSLVENGIKALPIHADMSLSARLETVQKFRDGHFQAIVATDVMARGIDIDDLDAVVNYDVPHVSEDYIHRVGRVGRQGRDGFSLTFINTEKLVFTVGQRVVGLNEQHLIKNLEKLISKQINYSKIPGPWNEDQANNDTNDDQQQQQYSNNNNKRNNNNEQEDDEKRHQNKLERKQVVDILLKRNILEKIEGPYSKGLPRVKFNPNAKISNRMMAKLKIDRKGEILQLPPITDFGDGRYEEVISNFDKNSARTRGVGIKQPNRKTFIPSKIMTKRQEKKVSRDKFSNQPIQDNKDLDYQ